MRSIVVALNGVYQQINSDFVAKGHSIVFKNPPTGTLDITAITDNHTSSPMSSNLSSYTCTGKQTTFHLPAYPAGKFAVVSTYQGPIPKGYAVIDVDAEIDLWIRENCAVSDWKWADQLDEAIGFNMSRLIVKESIVTFIATKWSA